MSDTVKINISNSLNDTVSFERNYSKELTVGAFKIKLEPITGACAGTMKLELYSGNRLLATMDDNDKQLHSYSVEDGMRVHVVDSITVLQENVEKFELSDEAYAQKTDTLRSFLQRNRLGKYNDEEMAKIEEDRKRAEAETAAKLETMTIGARCRVTTKGSASRIGAIMYKGPLPGKPGTFVGVKFDEPYGVNDGTIDGKRYFTCDPRYGSFVPPKVVEVGDFPPLEVDFDDEI